MEGRGARECVFCTNFTHQLHEFLSEFQVLHKSASPLAGLAIFYTARTFARLSQLPFECGPPERRFRLSCVLNVVCRPETQIG